MKDEDETALRALSDLIEAQYGLAFPKAHFYVFTVKLAGVLNLLGFS